MKKEQFWKNYFKTYDILNNIIPYQNLIHTIIDNLDIRKGDKILDVGSGTGNIAIRAKKLGGDVVGIDASQAGAELHKNKDKTADVVIQDITQIPWPFKDNIFDKVYSNNTIYAIEREKREIIFKEIYRILKPGGIFVVSNIIEGFSPIKIYFSHISSSFRVNGFMNTFIDIIKLTVPTVKMFYYNYFIKRENKKGSFDFFSNGEQKKLLEKSHFKGIGDDVILYAGQAVLNKAVK